MNPRPRFIAALIVAVALFALTGCSVTLYSRSWWSQAACDAMPEEDARTVQDCARYEYAESYHNAAGGYASACVDLPGMLGDDC